MRFDDFRDKHRGEKILVCGLGESLNLLDHPERFIIIGVNDIGRKFHPTYLLNINIKSSYKGDRFQYVENSKAHCIFSHLPALEHGTQTAPIILCRIAHQPGGVEIVDGKLPHFRNSPYVAVALAGFMGAQQIGLLGVDYTEHHFWTKDGPYRGAADLERINAQYGKLACYLSKQKQELINLSPISRLTSLRKLTLAEWSRL